MWSTPLADIPRLWRRFLIDLTFARNYLIGFIDLPGPAPKNPVLERLLPSLLHIKAVAILDHGLGAWIDANSLKVPMKPYGNKLKGKIDYLADEGHLGDRHELQRIRDIRNDLAHDPGEAVAWEELAQDVTAINEALKKLGIVGDMPQFDIYAERSAAQESPDPKVNCVFRYQIAVKDGNKVVCEITWSEHLLNDDA
jgi:hypothetical protein